MQHPPAGFAVPQHLSKVIDSDRRLRRVDWTGHSLALPSIASQRALPLRESQSVRIKADSTSPCLPSSCQLASSLIAEQEN